MRAPLNEWLVTDPPEPSWLVPNLLVKGSMILLAGDPGVGKSVLSYSLGLSLAVGAPFLGRPLEPARTLYFDEENSEPDSRSYLHSLWLGMNRPDPLLIQQNFYLERFGLAPFQNPYDAMRATIKVHQPDLIIVDTATPACRIKDENDNAEASLAIRQLRIAKACAPSSCTMLILKHARIDRDSGSRDIRGAKAWKGECDGLIFHTLAPHRPPTSGWRDTRLHAGKVRAYGLRTAIEVHPVEQNGGYFLTAQ